MSNLVLILEKKHTTEPVFKITVIIIRNATSEGYRLVRTFAVWMLSLEVDEGLENLSPLDSYICLHACLNND